jgi:hypothetical protein
MTHTILYFGHFDRNFRSLLPETTTYRDKDSVEKDAEVASEKVDGLKSATWSDPGRSSLRWASKASFSAHPFC